MRVHYLQHAECDGPGTIINILQSRGHTLTSTLLYRGEDLPVDQNFDWLIIMGGDMAVHDEADFPWLIKEKAFIRSAIDSDKLILGICLGAQLLAQVLGACVHKNSHKELGWFPVTPLDGIKNTILSNVITGSTELFHWHDDTFDLPEGACAIAESPACRNQGFIYRNKIVGLQFHPEISKTSAAAFFQECGEDQGTGQYLQSQESILSNDRGFDQSIRFMEALLKAMEK